jgi:AraC-like DNA-binding protein
MDALSDVLQTVRLTGGVFLVGRFTAPFRFLSQVELHDCRPYLTKALQLVAYHHVVEGSILVSTEDGETLEVKAGETVLLPRNDPHWVASAENVPATNIGPLVQRGADGKLAQIEFRGGNGPTAKLICGYLGSDQFRNPVIETLPRLLKIATSPEGEDGLLETSVRFAAQGLRRGEFGDRSIMCKLSELLFIEAVRRYVPAAQKELNGWLAGMRDPAVGKALALIHARLNYPWTAEELAGEVALSRSAFNDRFTALIGMPPKRYLLQWRLKVAQEKLRDGALSIAQVAHEVGYEAEEAFNRAFKREFGLPPSAWRKQAVQESGATH